MEDDNNGVNAMRRAFSGHENIFGSVTNVGSLTELAVESHLNRCKKYQVNCDLCGRAGKSEREWHTHTQSHGHDVCTRRDTNLKRMKIRYSIPFRHVFVLRSVSKRCPSKSPDMKFSNILLLFFSPFLFVVVVSCTQFGWKPVAVLVQRLDFLGAMLLVACAKTILSFSTRSAFKWDTEKILNCDPKRMNAKRTQIKSGKRERRRQFMWKR